MSASPQEFTAQVSEGPITAHLAATFAGLPVYVHTIEHAEGVVLVDTGMIDSTPELDEEGAPVPMPENLPRDVVCVINTHLHFDHIGGNRLFPGVPIHVQRLELQAPYDPPEWVDFPGATYVEHDGEAEVLPGIRLLPTPGHTPGHQSVLVDTPDGLVVVGGDVAYTFDELESGTTEGQRRVLALAAPTWLTHADEGPKVPRADPAVRFTRINIKKDLEDLGPRFDGAPDLEFRAATKALALERSALSYQRVPPRYRFPYGHTHVTQEEVYVVVRGSGRMKVGDEVFELEEWDAVRVPPGMWRGYEAGPEGLEILVIGAPNLGEDPREDVEGQRDWWADQ